MLHPHVFHFPTNLNRQDLADALVRFGELKRDEPVRVQDTYCDTFDWRLLQEGMAFLLRDNEAMLRPLGSDAVALHAQVDGVPKLLRDFPEGELRTFLEPVIEVRALLPLLRVNLERFPLRVCDAQGKTRVRIEWEDLRDADREDTLWQRARVFVFKGYEQVARQVCQALLELGAKLAQVDGEALVAGFTPDPNADLALEMMRDKGLEPGGYVGKPKWELRADMTAETAAGCIFLALADVIEANVQGILDDIDIEFLHDFRVATRKTRAGLSQLQKVFTPDALEHYKSRFRALGHMTNQMRDLDVYLDDADRYRQLLPEAQRQDLEPFFQHLRDTRAQALKQLMKDLDAFDLPFFLQEWRAFWSLGEQDMGSAAHRPVGKLASKLLQKRYAVVLRDGGAIGDQTPDQELHDLRIQCKKLRYMLEFFASLMPEKKLKYLVKQLKGLQDVLGRFNDYYVQQETLKDYAATLGKTKSQRQTVFAVGVLVGKLHQQQRDVRGHFAEAFAHFASPDVQQLFNEVCMEAQEVKP